MLGAVSSSYQPVQGPKTSVILDQRQHSLVSEDNLTIFGGRPNQRTTTTLNSGSRPIHNNTEISLQRKDYQCRSLATLTSQVDVKQETKLRSLRSI